MRRRTACSALIACLAAVFAACGESPPEGFPVVSGKADCPAPAEQRPDSLAFFQPVVPVWPEIVAGLEGTITPEGAVAEHLRAMATGDYDAFLASWTERDVQTMQERDREKGRSAKTWKSGWSRLFAEYDRVNLVARARVDDYVVLGYEMLSRRDSPRKKLSRSLVVERGDDDRWRLTNEISSDPRILSWPPCVP